ncbi:hypothetical protein [Komagataeibacter sp. FNDCR2]|uniref:hypothetical protein n=1 Tax=Komagataeibacter sp. FNDCR2 TaxID=2878682 RepID=UPI001E49D936|nr:hypothetical protein [Komagataeibacter sp. FNDCR2]MCE2575634.1 hypothetical protein [Komagataeibacter sp. FNDCR2]
MLPDMALRPAGLMGLDGACTAAGLLGACMLVLAVRAVVHGAWPARCVVLRGLMLALALPGLWLALWWPTVAQPMGVAGSVVQGVLGAPAAMWPILRVMDRIPPGLVRTASGLGADAKARLRLVWLPLLGGPVAGVGVFSGGMIVLCVLAAGARQ